MNQVKVDIIPDVVYGQGVDRRESRHGRVINMDLLGDFYTADLPIKGPRPCGILIHGGSWERGTRKQQGWWGNPAAREGHVAFCPDHRLSYQSTFPGPLEDMKCAVRFVRKHAAEYNIDPNKIYVAGGSSGAHLAMMVGLTPGRWEGVGGHENTSSEVQAVVSIAGTMLLPSLAYNGYLQRLIGGTIQQVGIERYLEASPYCYVHKDAPPLLLMHGTKDWHVPYEQSTIMRRLCIKMFGLKADLITAKGDGHHFFLTEEQQIKWLGKMFGWLRETLQLEKQS